MRDTHATGIGSIMGAGTAGYCVGNLQLDGMPLPGEDTSFSYPPTLASPLQVPPTLPDRAVETNITCSFTPNILDPHLCSTCLSIRVCCRDFIICGWEKSLCRHSCSRTAPKLCCARSRLLTRF